MNLKRRIPALVLASGLALATAACDAGTTEGTDPGVTDPGVTDPVQDPAGGGDTGGDDLGG